MSLYLRRHYGYSEAEIGDFIELYGMDWVFSAYRKAKEQEYLDRMWELNCSIASQTPQTKEGARGWKKHVKQMERIAKSQVPWLGAKVAKGKRADNIKSRMKRKPESKVVMSGNLPSAVSQFFGKLNNAERTE